MRVFIRPIVTASSLGLLALCLSTGSGFAQPKPAPAMQAPAEEAPQPVEQIALTDKQVQSLVAGQKDISAVASKIPESQSDKPDPATQAKLDGVAKKYGFADYGEYDNVASNVSLVMSGFDPQTKQFIGPDAVLKKEIAEVKADKQMPAKDKKQALDSMAASLKTVVPVKFPDNIKIVSKYYDKLGELMQDAQ